MNTLSKTNMTNNVDTLVQRLKGNYAIGPHLPNGNPEFGWRQFQSPPICHEAAERIVELEKEIQQKRDELTKMNRRIKNQRERLHWYEKVIMMKRGELGYSSRVLYRKTLSKLMKENKRLKTFYDVVVGWREFDHPEGFCRRTVEWVVNNAKERVNGDDEF